MIRSIKVDFRNKKIKSSHYLGYLKKDDDFVILIRLFLEFEAIMTQSHYIMVSLKERSVKETTVFEEGSTQDIPALFNGNMSADRKHFYLWDHKNTIQMLSYNYTGCDF